MGPDKRIRVDEIIDHSPLSRFQLTIFLLCFSVAVFDGYDIGTISSMAPLIAEHFHVRLDHFGPLFSIGFVGMMVGALLIGSAADRIGRRWAIIVATFIFGLFTFLIAFAPSPAILVALRFVVGVGLGGALPNVIALTSEYAPKRSRALTITLMSCGITIGGVAAPAAGSYIGPAWGWQASFIIGGLLPMIECIFLILILPESMRFLLVNRRPKSIVLGLLEKMNAALPPGANTSVDLTLGDEDSDVRANVGELFRHGRLPATLLLWGIFFFTLLIALFIVSWLPGVLRGKGLETSTALLLASLFSAGGLIGAALLGRVIDALGPYVVLFPTYVLSAGFIAEIGNARGVPFLAAVIFFAGFFVFGAQACIQALAATFYPTAIRSAGIGWAWGVGRLGSILGPLLGGMMLREHWAMPSVFLAAATPALLAAVCSALMWWTVVRNDDGHAAPVAVTGEA